MAARVRQKAGSLVVKNAQQTGEKKLIVFFDAFVRKAYCILEGFRMKEFPNP